MQQNSLKDSFFWVDSLIWTDEAGSELKQQISNGSSASVQRMTQHTLMFNC